MTTPERYDHTDDGFETANDGDFVSYDDYAALLARAEQAEARVAELEGALDAVYQYGSDTITGPSTDPRGSAPVPADTSWYRLGVIEMTRRARAALSREPMRCAEPDWNEWSSWPEGRTWTKAGEPKP
jgi:hypothetical protein